jgi:hypothetical protein
MYVLLASAQDQNDSIDNKYEIIPTRIGKICLESNSEEDILNGMR